MVENVLAVVAPQRVHSLTEEFYVYISIRRLVEDFVDVDEDLATNAMYTATATLEELIEDDVTEVDMESESSTPVTYNDAVSSLQVVQSYFESCSLSYNDSIFVSISNIEESMLKLKVSKCKQSKASLLLARNKNTAQN